MAANSRNDIDADLNDRAAHDLWFRDQVQRALASEAPAIPHDEVKTKFAARRAATLRSLG